MHLTPLQLEGAYNYLRATTPDFRDLPESDVVEFCVTRTRPRKDGTVEWGDYTINKQRIRISTAHRNHGEVLATMAHEMCHMRQYESGRRDSADHGPKFKKIAKRVCKSHGFDPATF